MRDQCALPRVAQHTLRANLCRTSARTAEALNACNVQKDVRLAQSYCKVHLTPHACTPLSRISQCMHVHISTSATERGEALARLYLLRPIHPLPHATLLAVLGPRLEHSRSVFGLKRSATPPADASYSYALLPVSFSSFGTQLTDRVLSMHAARRLGLQVNGAEEGFAAFLSGGGLPQACSVRNGQPQVEVGRQQRRMLHLHAPHA
jgi:hypothetical protein